VERIACGNSGSTKAVELREEEEKEINLYVIHF